MFRFKENAERLVRIRAIITLVTTILVIGPLSILLLTSIQTGLPLVDRFSPTFAHYASLFTSHAGALIWNTFVFAAGSLVWALIIATPLAFLTERTDMPFREGIYFSIYATMIFPVVIQILGWILLLSPRIGLINQFLRSTLGLDGVTGPFDIYSLEAMIFVTGLGVSSTTYVMLTAFMRTNPDLEEASTTAGAGFLTTFRRITMPLLMPGVFSVAVYQLMVLVQVFDAPIVLGIPANFPVLSLRVYLSTHPDQGMPVYGLAATYGVILSLLGLALMAGYFSLTRIQERFQVLGGRGFRPRRIRLGSWKYPAIALVVLLLVVKLTPSALLAWASVLPFYEPPSVQALQHLTLRHYTQLVENGDLLRAVGNTAILGLSVPTLTLVLAALIGWVTVRTPGVGFLEVVSFLPVAIPSTVVALALLVLLVRLPIYDTVWILVLAQVIHFIGYGVRVMQPAFLQLHHDLEDAAAVAGASPLKRLQTVSLPLLSPALFNTWLWISIHAIRDLSVPAMLYASTNVVLSVLIFQEWNAPNLSTAAAASMVLVAFVSVIFFLATLVRYHARVRMEG